MDTEYVEPYITSLEGASSNAEPQFVETELNGVKLRVFKDGNIMRYVVKTGNIHKEGWKLLKLKPNNTGYYAIGLNKRHFLLHRIMAMVYLGLDIYDLTKEIDHIDRYRTNNNINNLRIVTHQQNAFNTKAKGFSWHKQHQKWFARITINKKIINIGLFNTEEEARMAYLEAKDKYHIINHHPPHLQV